MIQHVWAQQKKYNQRVMERQSRTGAEWMQTYILGLMSECGQLLEAMRWKQNRLEEVEEFGPNVPEELADITKYVFSMWQLMGYTPEGMLEAVYQKGRLLDHLYTQEFETSLHSQIVVFDLDNVLAKTQEALAAYFQHQDVESVQRFIHLDLATNQRFDEYRELKSRWELEGGYAKLEPIYPLVNLFRSLRTRGISVVVWTARPVDIFRRIRQDTFSWFLENGAMPDMLRFGREDRIPWIAERMKEGKKVVLVEDDPNMIARAKLCDIPVIAPAKPYNRSAANFDGTVNELIELIGEKLNEQRG